MTDNPSSNKNSSKWIIFGAAGFAVLLCCVGVAGVLAIGNIQFFRNRLAGAPTAPQPLTTAIPVLGTPQPGAQPQPSQAPAGSGNATASTPGTSSTTPVTLILWTTTLSDTLNKQIALYQQVNPNITISVKMVTPKDIVNMTNAEAVSETPDLMLGDNSDLWRLVKAKVVQSLESIPQDGLKGFTSKALNGMTVNGKLYGIPVSFELAGFFYNTSMIDNPPATTDELSLLYKTGNKFGLVKSPYYMMGWFIAFGGSIADKNGRCISTTTGFEDAVNLMRQVRKYNSYLVAEPTFIREKFKAEQIGMIIDTSSMLPVYAQALEDRLASLPIPGVTMPAEPPLPAEVNPASPITQVTGFYLNAKSPNLKAATDFALALSSAQAQTAYMGDYWVPTRSDVKVTNPAIKGFVTGAQNGYLRPQASWFNNWERPFQEMIDQQLRDQFTIFDSVRLACKEMDTLNNK